MKKAVIILGIFLNFTYFIFSISSSDTSNSAPNNSDKIKNLLTQLQGGMPKNPIEIKDFKIIDPNNNNHNLFEFKGKVILLNLWATWCPPCREEMPSMQKLYEEYKSKNFTIVAVSGESMDTVKNFLSKNKYDFPIFIDDNNQLNRTYGTGSIPTTYLIDKNGFMIAQFVGGRNWSSPLAKELIDSLMK
jgi:cytochrome c biogenesis protein CcmG, thiol:disulfide interchange protein DsbE